MSQTKDQDSKREFSVIEKKSLTKTRPNPSGGKKNKSCSSWSTSWRLSFHEKILGKPSSVLPSAVHLAFLPGLLHLFTAGFLTHIPHS